jgi:NitT/TauT family transport system substrate-binding protein
MSIPRPRSPALAAILLIVLAALLLGCPRADKDAAPGAAATVKLQLNWVAEPEFGGFYAARESGAFKRAGLDVQIAGGAAGVPVVQMVAAGQADFGVTGADDVITARARGADVVAVFATYQTAPQGIMAHASRGAKSIADVLSAGTLAIEPGTAFGIFLRNKHGFDKVKVVPYDGGVARFVADKDFAQQCFVTSEPLAAKKLNADPQVFLVADDGYNPYQTVVFTRRALWKDKPDLVRSFVRAVREGWRAYLDDPGPTNLVMARLNTSMDKETFTAVAAVQKPLIETDETKRAKLGAMTRERWETLAKQLVDLRVIEKAPNVDDLFVTPGD